MLQTTGMMCLSENVTKPSVGVVRDRNYDHNKGRYKYHSPWDTNPHRLNTGPADQEFFRTSRMALTWRLSEILQEARWNAPCSVLDFCKTAL